MDCWYEIEYQAKMVMLELKRASCMVYVTVDARYEPEGGSGRCHGCICMNQDFCRTDIALLCANVDPEIE